MNSIINSTGQNLSVWQKKTEQANLPNQDAKAKQTQNEDSGIAQDSKDRVEIRNESPRSAVTEQKGNEIMDGDEAQQSVEKVVELFNTETGKSSVDQVHNLNPGSLIDVLA